MSRLESECQGRDFTLAGVGSRLGSAFALLSFAVARVGHRPQPELFTAWFASPVLRRIRKNRSSFRLGLQPSRAAEGLVTYRSLLTGTTLTKREQEVC